MEKSKYNKEPHRGFSDLQKAFQQCREKVRNQELIFKKSENLTLKGSGISYEIAGIKAKTNKH